MALNELLNEWERLTTKVGLGMYVFEFRTLIRFSTMLFQRVFLTQEVVSNYKFYLPLHALPNFKM